MEGLVKLGYTEKLRIIRFKSLTDQIWRSLASISVLRQVVIHREYRNPLELTFIH